MDVDKIIGQPIADKKEWVNWPTTGLITCPPGRIARGGLLITCPPGRIARPLREGRVILFICIIGPLRLSQKFPGGAHYLSPRQGPFALLRMTGPYGRSISRQIL